MRRAAIVALCHTGCNAVFGLEPSLHSDAVVDDALDVDDATDAPAIDATACVTDDFDGTTLDPHWTLHVGALPTMYSVGGSRILIGDAPFASTPSSPTLSWIYDLDVDKGNQLAWAHPIGDRDFAVDADLGWSSSLGELSLGAIAVGDDTGTMHAMVGARDGSATLNGRIGAKLRVAGGADLDASGPMVEPGSAHVRIERVSGIGTVLLDGAVLISAPMASPITQVSLVYVQFHDATATSYPYGSFEVARLDVCTY